MAYDSDYYTNAYLVLENVAKATIAAPMDTISAQFAQPVSKKPTAAPAEPDPPDPDPTGASNSPKPVGIPGFANTMLGGGGSTSY